MTPPLTQLEISGQRTSLAVETSFLTQIATETEATHTVVGYSDEGREIHRAEIGNPAGTTMAVIVMVHGSEPGAREGPLAWFRDLAYSTDPEVLAYLADHRVVMLTPANPDAFSRGAYATPYDVNRDYLAMVSDTSQVIVSQLRDIDPHLMVDTHEYGPRREGSADFTYFWTGIEANHEAIKQASIDACLTIVDNLEGQGVTTDEYFGPGRISGREMGAWHHCPSILFEAYIHNSLTRRAEVHQIALDAARRWQAANADHLIQIKATSKASVTQQRSYPLQHGAVSAGGNWRVTPLPANLVGYQITGDIPEKQFSVWGIDHQDGYVPLAQDKRVIIPILLDPASDNAVTTAVQVLGDSPDEPALPSDPVPASWRPKSIHVSVGGHLCPVSGVYHQIDGKLLPTKLR